MKMKKGKKSVKRTMLKGKNEYQFKKAYNTEDQNFLMPQLTIDFGFGMF